MESGQLKRPEFTHGSEAGPRGDSSKRAEHPEPMSAITYSNIDALKSQAGEGCYENTQDRLRTSNLDVHRGVGSQSSSGRSLKVVPAL
jgi:hypothetical protein